jgi:hypothetical protein
MTRSHSQRNSHLRRTERGGVKSGFGPLCFARALPRPRYRCHLFARDVSTLPSALRDLDLRASYRLPRDSISLETNDSRVVALADRLWDRALAGRSQECVAAALELRIEVSPELGPPLRGGPAEERWTVNADVAELFLGDELRARIDCVAGSMEARVSAGLVTREPSLAARLLLETSTAALLARRGYWVVHAGAVVGEAGAVVLRGPSGAGKSTLVAAAHRAGLGVLGDETVLVARDDADDLLSAVRDPMLLSDSWRALGFEERLPDASGTATRKQRLDLFLSSTPSARRARRLGTVILGPLEGSRAQLEPLAPGRFLAEFRRGEIPQERWSGTLDQVAIEWSRATAYRLTGARDLRGAVALLVELTGTPVTTSRP